MSGRDMYPGRVCRAGPVEPRPGPAEAPVECEIIRRKSLRIARPVHDVEPVAPSRPSFARRAEIVSAFTRSDWRRPR
jgi:hypothetical protein